MSVKFIIDSASDIGLEAAEKLDVGFAPLKTVLAGKEYRDGVDIFPDKFFGMLEANKELAHTSQVNAGEFADLFSKATENGDEVVVITLSSKLSGTFQSARIAAADFPGKVFVVDSLSATAGEQVLLQKGLKLRDEGKSAAEIFAVLNDMKDKFRLFVRLETLEYLKRGGRISKTAAFVGGVLHFMPVLTLKEGALESVGKARGIKLSHKLLNDSILAAGGIDFSEPVVITYAGDLGDGAVNAYLADSKEIFGGHEDAVTVGQLGCVIGTHTGPGAIVVSFVPKA